MVDPYSRSSHRVGEKSGGPSTLQQELASVMRDRRARGLAHDYSSASASNLSEDELDSDDGECSPPPEPHKEIDIILDHLLYSYIKCSKFNT